MSPRSAFLLMVLVGCKGSSAGAPSTPSTDGEVDAGDVFDAGQLPPTDTTACTLATGADAGGFSTSYALVHGDSYIQDKAFYLTTLLQKDAPSRAALLKDPTLSASAANRDARLRAAPAKCGSDLACYAAALRFTDAETASTAAALPTALGGGLATFASTHLRPSGVFILRADGTDAALLSAAWTDTGTALVQAYDDYAATLNPAALAAVVAQVVAAHPEPLLFFEPLLDVVVGAMVQQKRDEAARYEPLTTGDNRAALEALKTTDWSAYPYTALIVPGEGPGSLDYEFDPIGRLRCDLAFARYEKKLAPFFIVSGGHVHPDKTPYCEAMEMKRYLKETKGVPESAIFVDPHARHTTTNIRNVSRQLFRYGFPTERPALITSDQFQSIYMAYHEGEFDTRCKKELGYLPYRILTPLTENDSCLLPSPLTLYGDGRDALDP